MHSQSFDDVQTEHDIVYKARNRYWDIYGEPDNILNVFSLSSSSYALFNSIMQIIISISCLALCPKSHSSFQLIDLAEEYNYFFLISKNFIFITYSISFRFSLPYHLPRKHHQISNNNHPHFAQTSPSNGSKQTPNESLDASHNTSLSLPPSNATFNNAVELASDNNSTNLKVQNDTTTISQSDIKLDRRINEDKKSEAEPNHQSTHHEEEPDNNEVSSHITDIHHTRVQQHKALPVKKTKYQDFDLSLNKDEGLLGSIMKVLGLNQCPITPPDLVGPIKPDLEYEELDEVEKKFASIIRTGGRSSPKECRAASRVALIVPYRDRKQHLPIFLKNMHSLLIKQQIDYGIFIVEQSLDGSFNRAKLMNVGFTEALKANEWDCFIFHDIDLIPLDDRNLYTCPDQPRHMSVAVDSLGFKWVCDYSLCSILNLSLCWLRFMINRSVFEKISR